eukprot:TRINITY_DN5027_c0_g1_i4.p1 TRINITY_DN5027_c0_g1~~TRINITY_DN5027_c0_g1_i4.p1  ORF type:complete len:419 (+),score=88.21 TRINITY_DN5027_c0_g1_i4:23-1279(+)
MNYIERILDGVHSVFNVNEATLSGAVDVIVVRQSDGSLKSTPFHVRFGKLKLFSYRENRVSLVVNGNECKDVMMKLGSGGVGFFVRESEGPVTPLLATSPIPDKKDWSTEESFEDYVISSFEEKIHGVKEDVLFDDVQYNNEIMFDSYQEFAISKCGPEFFTIESGKERKLLFDNHVLDYESLMDQYQYHEILPMLENNMVFKIDDKYYNWKVAGPMFVSRLLFDRTPPGHIVEKLKSEVKEHEQAPPPEPSKKNEKRSWFFWRTGKEEKKKEDQSISNDSTSESFETSSSEDDDPENSAYCLSLVPTTAQLESMGLVKGKNVLQFRVESKHQGVQEIHTNVYLWDINAKVVISDIDGTITKSDLFGHILPVLGKDWSHSGVAELYTNIKETPTTNKTALINLTTLFHSCPCAPVEDY